MHNCLQFDTITVILDKRVKSQEVSEVNLYSATHPTSGHRHLFQNHVSFP